MAEENIRRLVTGLLQKISLVLLGVLLSCALLEVGLRLGGIILSSAQEYGNRLSLKEGSFRIMCLGESTTALGGKDSYPSYLEKILNENKRGIHFSVINKGIPGVRTKRILGLLDGNLKKYEPDMVIAMMGINDKGLHLPKENTILPFLEQVKVYRLMRFLWLRILAKTEEILRPEVKPFTLDYIDNRTGKSGAIAVSAAYAVNYFREDIAIHPRKFIAHYLLGQAYMMEGMLDEAEAAFEEAIKINPKAEETYKELGYVYEQEGKLAEAIDCFEKLVKINPRAKELWLYLYGIGCLYRDTGKFYLAEKFFKKAAKLNPRSDGPVFDLGCIYRTLRRLNKSRKAFEKALAINPSNHKAYNALGWVYRDQGKIEKSEEMFKMAIAQDQENDQYYAGLAVIYDEQGKVSALKNCTQKIEALRRLEDNPALKDSYFALKAILDKKKIRLVCVQYPMRNLYPLKSIFAETGNIIFVDNEIIFKDAIMAKGYNAYFSDMFAGDFGHCTPEGNRLLADNIAKSIFKEYFYE